MEPETWRINNQSVIPSDGSSTRRRTWLAEWKMTVIRQLSLRDPLFIIDEENMLQWPRVSDFEHFIPFKFDTNIIDMKMSHWALDRNGIFEMAVLHNMADRLLFLIKRTIQKVASGFDSVSYLHWIPSTHFVTMWFYSPCPGLEIVMDSGRVQAEFDTCGLHVPVLMWRIYCEDASRV